MRMLLEGIRILDLTTAVAGPTATQALADLGAEVIKIEGPRHADRRRLLNMPPEQLKSNRLVGGAAFCALNRSKMSVSLDLSRPEGKSVFKSLVRLSDIVMENFTLRVMPNLGLDYPALREINPAIICISMPGYGAVGPYKEYPSWGETIEATSGLAHLTGYEDGPPMRSPIIMPDPLAGMNAALATMLCVHDRLRTGRGQHVTLSQLEGATQLVSEQILDSVMNGRTQNRSGNAHPFYAPHGMYPCAGDDEWVAVAVTNQEEWHGFQRALGDPVWARRSAFETPEARNCNASTLNGYIAEWTGGRNKHEVMRILQQEGVPAGAVLTTADLVRDPHLVDRCFYWEYGDSVDEDATLYRYPGARAKFQGAPDKPQRRTPAFAEHNAIILEGVLGLSSAEIEALREAEVISDAPIFFI